MDKEKEEYLLLLQEEAYEMKLAEEKEAYQLASVIAAKKAEAYERKLAEEAYERKLAEEILELSAQKTMAPENHSEEKTGSDDFPSSVGPQTETVLNLGNEIGEIVESYLKDLPPLLRQKEIVVTEENQFEWEQILQHPHHLPTQPTVGPKKRLMAQDIMMVENQIPFMVLREINEALHLSSGKASSSTNKFSPSIFRTFCEIHSPLKLCSKSQAPSTVDHLLHYMYYLIVNNLPGDQLPESRKSARAKFHRDELPHSRKGKSLADAYSFITKVPQKEIVQAYEQTISVLEAFTQSKILIPSASKLHDKAGFRFHRLEKHEGVQKVGIQGKDIYLPSVTLNNDSEVILRNLIAYETLMANFDSYPLTEYMGLMCALIVNVDDVKLLKDKEIINGDLGADEVAKLFAGMSSSIPIMKTKEKSKLQEMIYEINKVYESGLMMKTYLLLKKLARWLLVGLRAVGGFVEASWKIVAFIVSIVTVFLLTSQAYCNVYGCDKTTVMLLPYASS